MPAGYACQDEIEPKLHLTKGLYRIGYASAGLRQKYVGLEDRAVVHINRRIPNDAHWFKCDKMQVVEGNNFEYRLEEHISSPVVIVARGDQGIPPSVRRLGKMSRQSALKERTFHGCLKRRDQYLHDTKDAAFAAIAGEFRPTG